MGYRNHRGRNDDGGVGCALMLGLAIFAMPFVGLYLFLKSGNEDDQLLGVALMIIGIIIFIGAAINM